MIKIGASILTADFSKLGEQIRELEKAGVDIISFDVMDGHFVDNISLGSCVIKSCRNVTKLPFECHLMIENPERYVKDFIDAGCDIITAHVESTNKLENIIRFVKGKGKRIALAIKPETSAEVVFDYLDYIDMVLVMTVNPGSSGRKFIDMSDKIKILKNEITERGLSIEIMVDGGINEETARIVKDAGATILISASYIFGNDYKTAVEALRNV